MSLAGAKRFAKPFVRLECNRSVAASNRETPLRIFPLPSPVPHRKTKTLLSDRLCIHLPARRAQSAVDSTATCPPASRFLSDQFDLILVVSCRPNFLAADIRRLF